MHVTSYETITSANNNLICKARANAEQIQENMKNLASVLHSSMVEGQPSQTYPEDDNAEMAMTVGKQNARDFNQGRNIHHRTCEN